MKHSRNLVEKIVNLRKNNATLGEIMRATGLAKTTIYHHIKNIPKTKELKKRVREAGRANREAIANRHRGKTRQTYKFLKPYKWNADLVRLVSHFCFDGEIRQRSCVYTNRSKVLLERVKALMDKLLDVREHKQYDKFLGVKAIYYNNVEIAEYMRTKAKELWDYIQLNNTPGEHKTAFLSSFFDDEGNIDYNGPKKRIRGYQHNEKTLHIVQKLLAEQNIQSVVWPRFNELVISRRENIKAFAEKINFSPGIRVNGKRTNSRWKRSLEKREILRMALASYKN